MATGASNSDLAVILIDARKGVLTQTRRHATICSLLGIRHVVLAVNKIDLVGFDKAIFDRIVGDFTAFAAGARLHLDHADPDVGALRRQRHRARRGNMPWYHGPTLLEHLETVDVEARRRASKPFRFPVQWVNRPNLDFRGFRRHGRLRSHPAGRRGGGRGLRQGLDGRAHRHAGRRPRARRRPATP